MTPAASFAALVIATTDRVRTHPWCKAVSADHHLAPCEVIADGAGGGSDSHCGLAAPRDVDWPSPGELNAAQRLTARAWTRLAQEVLHSQLDVLGARHYGEDAHRRRGQLRCPRVSRIVSYSPLPACLPAP